MIVFDLICGSGHVFEAWFSSSSSFQEQKEASLLECPHCGSHTVKKAMMAPNVGAKGNQKLEMPNPSPDLSPDLSDVNPQVSVSTKPAVMPNAELVEKAQNLIEEFRQTVEKNCDNVGTDFAEEARKIHYGEADERGIYGESTPEETKDLLEEGIEIFPVPSMRRTDT